MREANARKSTGPPVRWLVLGGIILMSQILAQKQTEVSNMTPAELYIYREQDPYHDMVIIQASKERGNGMALTYKKK